MQPITKHLVKVALILLVVTIVSLGIRHVRLNSRRAYTVESPVMAETELESDMDLLRKIDYKLKSRYADLPVPDEEMSTEDYSEAKLSKRDYAKGKGKKGLEKISLGDNEDLYITTEGDLWYVSRQPDGTETKNRALIDETTGEMILIDPEDVDK